MAVIPWNEAVGDQVSHDPALDATRSSVDGGVLETSGAVARPVMCRARGRCWDGCRCEVAIGSGLCELDGVRRGEVEEGCGLACVAGADEVEGLVAVAASIVERVGVLGAAQGRSVSETLRLGRLFSCRTVGGTSCYGRTTVGC